MAVFEYQALEHNRRTVKGTVESDSLKAARQQIKSKGLILLSIHEIRSKERSGQTRFLTARLGMRTLTHITRQLAALLKSGLALDDALQIIASQLSSASSKSILLAVRSRVLEGQSLAQACQWFPSSFPALYRATIEAGESSGKLDLVLDKLADYLSDKAQLHRKLQMAMIYPLMLTVVSLLVVIGLLAYVVPEITGVFDKMNQRLPDITQALISCSNFVKQYGGWTLLLLMGLALVAKLLLRRAEARMWLHQRWLKLPLISAFARGLNNARFTRTLAILTNSGVDLLIALRIASQVLSNDAMRSAVEQAAIKVREGVSLNKALEVSRLFPPVTIHLIASGESSGQLPRMLESAADDQERDIQALTELTLGLFEPGLILTMGLVVLVIVLAILLPIFEMNQLIR